MPPILCYVTDRRSLRGVAPSETQAVLLTKIAAAAAAGVDWIQIREKDLPGGACVALTQAALRQVANAAGASRKARILVNDRLDVALAGGAGGVHLGEQSLPAAEVKRLLQWRAPSLDFLVGVSCHSLEASQAAASAGADYIFFGPVFATPSKAAFGPPQGLERLAEVSRAVSIPVMAIGGITLEKAASCIHAGAAGLAAIRLFQDAEDIGAIVRELESRHEIS
jgi:thiamine-phosphate pyrophosphorylase